jgi:hypothetical protein
MSAQVYESHGEILTLLTASEKEKSSEIKIDE